MPSRPAYAATPVMGFGQVSTANTNRDGTGTIVDILQGVAPSTQVFEVVVDAQVTTTAGMVRLYLHNGTNYRLFDEIVVPAITVAAGTAGFRGVRQYRNLWLPPISAGSATYYKLAASTHNAEAMNVYAFGANFV